MSSTDTKNILPTSQENQKNLEKIYTLYSQGRFEEAKKINDEVLILEPTNIYAKRYAQLLSKKELQQKKEKIPTIKGKQIKCPKCLSRIPASSIDWLSLSKIYAGKYENLNLNCPYCQAKFTLQKKKSSSPLGIKIGATANIEGAKYRVTGSVEYRWEWQEFRWDTLDSSGRLTYIEWLLIGEKNTYLYLSESISWYQGEREVEYEISEKITPKETITLWANKRSLEIGKKTEKFHDICEIEVHKVHGEQSKSYTIGEKVYLAGNKNFVIEIEQSAGQKEIGIYTTKKLSTSQAFGIFWKSYGRSHVYRSSSDIKAKWVIIYTLLVGSPIIILSGLWKLILLFSIIFWICKFVKKVHPDTTTQELFKLGWIQVGAILLWMLCMFISTLKTPGTFSNLQTPGSYILMFSPSDIGPEYVTGRTSYDYGGIRTSYEQKIWIKFKIQDEEDKKVIQRIEEKNNTYDPRAVSIRSLDKQIFRSTIKYIQQPLDFIFR